MKVNTAILAFFSITLLILGGNATFNYVVDAQCYYHCSEISLNKVTTNAYYQDAQKILTYPDTKVVIIGSSRGETLPPLWVESVLGQRTVNLSVAGAELMTKRALLNIATTHAPVEKVIWLADYFELITENQDAKIKKTPALRKYLPPQNSSEGAESVHFFSALQGLIDHNTTSASLQLLKRPPHLVQTQGGAGIMDIPLCNSEEFKGSETAKSLETKVHILYQTYVNNVIRPAQNTTAWKHFKEAMYSLTTKNIEVLIVVIPYHPTFLAKLKNEYPEIYKRHQEWAQQIESLQGPQITTLNFLDGFEHDDGSPKYWNDGVHFTCHSGIKMLNSTLSEWK